jgi:hypothetical protein
MTNSITAEPDSLDLPADVEEINRALKHLTFFRWGRISGLLQTVAGTGFLLAFYLQNPTQKDFVAETHLCLWIPILGSTYILINGLWNLLGAATTFPLRDVIAILALFVMVLEGEYPHRAREVEGLFYLFVAFLVLWALLFILDIALRRLRLTEWTRNRPSAAAIKWAREGAREVRRARPAKEEDSIQFFTDWNIRVRAKMLGDMALFTDGAFHAQLAHRDEIRCIPEKPRRKKRLIPVTVHVGDWKIDARIRPEFLERFQAWLAAT